MEKVLIPNCPITKAEIICAEDILGLNLGSLKGETTHKMPSRVILNPRQPSRRNSGRTRKCDTGR